MKINIDKQARRRFCQLGMAKAGWTDGWQSGWWDWVLTAYWQTVPYRWRPSIAMDRFLNWVWVKPTTIRPRTVGNHRMEYGLLLPHVMFEVLVRYVEQEKVCGKIDLVSAEVIELYDWWNLVFVPYHERERVGGLTEKDDAIGMYAELVKRCKKLVECGGMLWRN